MNCKTIRITILATALLGTACVANPGNDDGLSEWRRADAATRTAVVSLARKAFDAYVLKRETIDPPEKLPAILKERAAVFVSTMRAGAPRCCMGTLYPVEPSAAQEIITNAVAAAGRDRRFPPVKPSELKGLTLIVSVLGRPRPIGAGELTSLDPVRDGLVARSGALYGVVLSGETPHRDRMIDWARIRAGARPEHAVEFFRVEDVRLVEGRI